MLGGVFGSCLHSCVLCVCVYVFLIKWRNLNVIEYKNKNEYNLANVSDLCIILS